MTQLLSSPFENGEVAQVLDQLERDLEVRPGDDRFDRPFLCICSGESGRGRVDHRREHDLGLQPDGEIHTLLADFDMASGMIEFLFDTSHDRNLADTAAHGKQLDDDAWRSLIKPWATPTCCCRALRGSGKGFLEHKWRN